MILCAISQSAFFAVSYSGRLERLLDGIKLDNTSAKYCRRVAVIYTSVAWAMVLVNLISVLVLVFIKDGDMDYVLAPIKTHVDLSDLLVPRIVTFLSCLHLSAAWIFPHAMSFMLATIFTHQYKMLNNRMLAESDERRLSDADIETFMQRHNEISKSVNGTDDFLMFHNAGAFCCQLFKSIVHLYGVIFFHTPNDSVIGIIIRVFWILGSVFGLGITTAGGIMVNHYVSTNANYYLSAY